MFFKSLTTLDEVDRGSFLGRHLDERELPAQIDGFERRVEETELLADVVKLAAEVAHDLLLS